MKSRCLNKIFSVIAVLCFAITLCAPVQAAPKRVGFTFTRNDVPYERKTNNTPAKHTAAVTPSLKGIDGYIVMYARTHTGDGKPLAKPDKAIAAPSQSGIYKAIVEFSKSAGYVCENGELSQEYPAALTIRRVHQDAATLRSGCDALQDNADGSGGSIAVSAQGVLATLWGSGVTPVYSWSAGSNEIVQMEDGKPARFTAIAPGTATLTVSLPEDNNHYSSEETHYTVTVIDSVSTSGGYELVGDKSIGSDWYISSVEVKAKQGYSGVVVTGPNPVTDDGITSLGVQIKAVDGSLSQDEQIKIKKDTVSPNIDNITVNDAPYTDAPLGEKAWSAANALTVKADITDETSGVSKIEYRIDDGKYQSDETDALSAEGVKSFPYTHTIDTGGEHTLWLRATDWAGNQAEKAIAINTGAAQSAASSSSAVSSVPTEASAPTEPTEAMQAVQARLDYLHKCDIEATVRGDIRANSRYIEDTLDMYKALTADERRLLGHDTLLELKVYFTALFTLTGRSSEELTPLFTFEQPLPPASSSPPIASQEQAANSAAAKREESIPVVGSAPSSASASASTTATASSSISMRDVLPALVPIAVLIVAVGVYFVWKKRINKEISTDTSEIDAMDAELAHMQRMLDKEEKNRDAYDDFDDLL